MRAQKIITPPDNSYFGAVPQMNPMSTVLHSTHLTNIRDELLRISRGVNKLHTQHNSESESKDESESMSSDLLGAFLGLDTPEVLAFGVKLACAVVLSFRVLLLWILMLLVLVSWFLVIASTMWSSVIALPLTTWLR